MGGRGGSLDFENLWQVDVLKRLMCTDLRSKMSVSDVFSLKNCWQELLVHIVSSPLRREVHFTDMDFYSLRCVSWPIFCVYSSIFLIDSSPLLRANCQVLLFCLLVGLWASNFHWACNFCANFNIGTSVARFKETVVYIAAKAFSSRRSTAFVFDISLLNFILNLAGRLWVFPPRQHKVRSTTTFNWNSVVQFLVEFFAVPLLGI